jgi:hypothetical protein
MKVCSCVLMIVVLAAAPLRAQALPPDSLFDRLIGRWVLAGTIARRATTHDVTFEWVLGRDGRAHAVERVSATPRKQPTHFLLARADGATLHSWRGESS